MNNTSDFVLRFGKCSNAIRALNAMSTETEIYECLVFVIGYVSYGGTYPFVYFLFFRYTKF